eukprot:7437438-Pyramimonas_sp.AAC.2
MTNRVVHSNSDNHFLPMVWLWHAHRSRTDWRRHRLVAVEAASHKMSLATKAGFSCPPQELPR